MTLKCIYPDYVCNQEVFQILFPQVVSEAKYETLCTHLVYRYDVK